MIWKNAQQPAEPEGPVTVVPLEPPEPLKVSWGASDQDPVPTMRAVRTIKVYSNTDNRQLRVMKTADAADCLHIYVDVV